MANFKLEGADDAPEEGKPTSAPSSAAPDEFSFFLDDEDKTKAVPTPPAPSARPAPASPSSPAASPARPAQGTPNPARPPAQVGAPAPNPSARQTGAAPGATPTSPNAARPANPATPQQPAPPNLMRPAQARADKSQPPGLNVPAAIAEMPMLTQPDAASIAQSSSPSDGFSGALQSFGDTIGRALDSGEDVFLWLARLVILPAGMGLAYILAAIFFGNAAHYETTTNPAQLVHFLTVASQVLCYSLLVLAASMLLLSYDDNRLGAIVAGGGLLLSFGFPLFLHAMLGATNVPASQMVPIFFNVGRMVLYIGLFKASIDLVLWAWNLPNQIKAKQSVAGAVGFGKTVESKQQKIARNANMFSPCWKLPFCREAIRVLCPAFLAGKTCWKFGRGCYCDEEMVGRIVRNEPIDQIKAATTRQSKEPAPCGRCYIFLEHQTYKFRLLSPLALPATILLMFGAWPLYNKLFTTFTLTYTKLFSTLSFTPKVPDAIKSSQDSINAAAATALKPEDIAQYSSYIFAGLLAFLLLINISKFIEWAIFKAKW